MRLVRPQRQPGPPAADRVQGPLRRRRGADLDLQQAAVLPEGEGPVRRRRPGRGPAVVGGHRRLAALPRCRDKRDAGKYEDSRAHVSPGRLLRHLDAGAAVRRQVDDHAGRRRRGRPGADPAVGFGCRGVRPLARHQRADQGTWCCSRPTAGATRTRRSSTSAPCPWLCNGAKQCGKKIDWLTDNKASGRRNANPHWSPDGRELRVHRPGEHRHRGRPDLDGRVRDRTSGGRSRRRRASTTAPTGAAETGPTRLRPAP